MDILFGPIFNPLQAFSLVLKILGVLIMCASVAFLARRNEVGWWLAMGSFALEIPGAMLTLPYALFGSAPELLAYGVSVSLTSLVGVGASIYGLSRFWRAPANGPLVRRIALRTFRPRDLVAPALVALLYAVCYVLPLVVLERVLAASRSLAGLPLAQLLLSGFCIGLLVGGLAGLARRSRWAWLLVAVSSLVSLLGVAAATQGSVLVFLFMAQAVLALYGFVVWGRFRAVSGSR
ncbi:nicotinamide mononucleotide transporter [Arthrobacter sp. A2-55]|uniref:nicotinamide mononucleotide transporter n=1 Tax=Arthrobacter sp. A2-55 TaxID=2897337 RepID=UPI0021CD681C|nr:nicotinamide mononucleotide transporter [Arthrobacter sp. A2-55]MCU6479705.1 nicotinamide mononucleotide transporter [Arthrobacter sp. A2-55]